MNRAAAALVTAVALALAAPAGAFADDDAASAAPTSTVPDQVLVGFTPDATPEQRSAARDAVDTTAVRAVGDDDAATGRAQDLTVDGADDGTLDALQDQPGVAWAEPIYRTHADATPPDTGFGLQWGLDSSGLTGGTYDDDIDAGRAWDLAGPGSSSVLVGVADSGVQPDHPGLAGLSIWTRPSDYRTQEGNSPNSGGCVVDVHGCDAVTGGTKPFDENGHGTAVGGIIFGNWSASSVYAGIAPASTLIPAKVLDTTGAGTTAALAAGLDFLGDAGARVVNVSVGGPYSQAVHNAIAAHPNTLFVASAGNAAVNVDAQPSFPCADPSANVICVAATDKNDNLASFSNYGAQSVDLAAPGQAIDTLSLGGGTGAYSGTSFAAPMVTGIAALAFSAVPTASVATVKADILWGADGDASLTGKVATGGRASAYNTIAHLLGVAVTPRPAVATPAAGSGTSGTTGARSSSAAAMTTGRFTGTTSAGAAVATTTAGAVMLRATAKVHGKKAIAITVTCVSSRTCSGAVRTRAGAARKDVTLKLRSGRTQIVRLPVAHARKIKSVVVSTGSGARVQALTVPVKKA
jgi:hypothetical protein